MTEPPRAPPRTRGFGGRATVPVVVYVLYLALLAWLLGHHAVWRDEVRAYSLALSASDPLTLIRETLADDGHPPLWHLILWAASKVWRDPAILKVASFSAAAGFTALVCFAAPFPFWIRALFLFGALPLHLHSVVSRNYGIADLFLLLLALEYSRGERLRPWRCGAYNLLLAITNLYGTVCSLAFLLVPPGGPREPAGPVWRRWRVIAPLTLAGCLLALYTVWPTPENLFFSRSDRRSAPLAANLLDIALDRDLWTVFHLSAYGGAERFRAILGPWLATGLGVGCQAALCLTLRRWRWALASYLAATLGGGLLAAYTYGASDRHVGVLTMHLLALLWVARARDPRTASRHSSLVLAGLGLAVTLHATQGLRLARESLRHDASQSARAGEYLARTHPGAVLLCEPDYFAESLPYYTPNPIYFVREDRMGTFARFRGGANRPVSLTELRRAADRLKTAPGVSVLISLPDRIERLGTGLIPGSFGRSLTISEEELTAFRRDYEELAAFTGEGLETYVFYRPLGGR